jgi:uncharacterized Rossmann fold enzyme
MLRIVTFNTGDYCSKGVEYTNVLHDMVQRNLPEGYPGTFTVFTDNPSEKGYSDGIEVREAPDKSLSGWWHKLSAFKDGLFEDGDRVCLLDLDSVICGPLDRIMAYGGDFATLRDFLRPNGLQSSVMMWPANTLGWLYDEYVKAGCPKLAGGDQEWLERWSHILRPDILQDEFPGDFCSFKVHASMGIPKGTKVCVFHGEPRPHQVTEDWVPLVWKIGGGTSASMIVEANISTDVMRENIAYAMSLGAHKLTVHDPHTGRAIVVAGGPSLAQDLKTIAIMQEYGCKVFAVNGTYEYLWKNGIKPDAHVVLDGRPENILFVDPDATCPQYYASQCHRSVLDRANNLIIFHPYFDGITDIVQDDSAYIGGGTTAGLKAVVIAHTLGFRQIHMFGFDSCYSPTGSNHAYAQPLNDGERVIDATYEGVAFRCAPWMVTQAEDFISLAPELISLGSEIVVHGKGFIPHIAQVMSKSVDVPAAELRAQAILSKLGDYERPSGVEVGVFTGELSKRLLGKRPDLSLLMVDSWSAQHNAEYGLSGDFHASLSQQEQDAYASHARAATSFAGSRATIIRKPSVEAAQAVPDASLDFAFIDADHSYEGCKADLHAWYPKVRPGGLFSGHDYENTDYPGFGVTQAVTEFAVLHGLHVELGANFTWHCRKPTQEC